VGKRITKTMFIESTHSSVLLIQCHRMAHQCTLYRPQFYMLKYSFCVVVEEPSENKESEELDLTGLDDAELDKV